MNKSYYTITVRGKKHEWVFPILVDPRYFEEWRADGLIIDEVVDAIDQRGWWDKLLDKICTAVGQVLGV